MRTHKAKEAVIVVETADGSKKKQGTTTRTRSDARDDAAKNAVFGYAVFSPRDIRKAFPAWDGKTSSLRGELEARLGLQLDAFGWLDADELVVHAFFDPTNKKHQALGFMRVDPKVLVPQWHLLLDPPAGFYW